MRPSRRPGACGSNPRSIGQDRASQRDVTAQAGSRRCHDGDRWPVNRDRRAPAERHHHRAHAKKRSPMNQETLSAARTIDAPATRTLAGVSVPDAPLITAAIEYAQRLSDPYLFNHAMRSWLFAEAIGRIKGVAYDREVVAV